MRKTKAAKASFEKKAGYDCGAVYFAFLGNIMSMKGVLFAMEEEKKEGISEESAVTETVEMTEEMPETPAAEDVMPEEATPEETAAGAMPETPPMASVQNPGAYTAQQQYYNQYTQYNRQPYPQQYGQNQAQYGQYPTYGQQLYGQPYAPYGQMQPPKREKPYVAPLTSEQKKIVLWLKIAAALLVAIFLYCIISDVVRYPGADASASVSQSQENAPKKSVHLTQESKPDAVAMDAAEDGAPYNAKEIAAIVGPSIVEIRPYVDGAVSGGGSGIILTEDGYILTNAHVVVEKDTYAVRIYGYEEPCAAELVGYDSKSDLAVLHVDETGLTPAALGSTQELTVGEDVMAIGSPAGLTNTVTKGIVSALDRHIRTEQTGFYMECIQTDAAISPGNSGGALVNMYGQVVGVTSSKYASFYGVNYEGLGFAISIDQALPIAEELMGQGYVSGRVRIGITFVSMEVEEVRAEFASFYNMTEAPEPKGVWIQEISEECDIASSGLQLNDLILSVNDTEVDNYDELCAAIEGIKAGVPLEAACRRYSTDGTHEDFTITFVLMEDTSGDY